MNIGILTFHRGPNYGGYLQAWHLRDAIRKLGHSAEIINYQNPILHATEQPRIRSLHPARIRHSLRCRIKARPFTKLVETWSSQPLTFDPERIAWQSYETIVVGSDVVWDFQTPHFGQDPTFFGMHPAQHGCRFISYAASCGPAIVHENVPDWVRSGISKFAAAGVRDENTRHLAESSGACPELVVDPTWLGTDPAPKSAIPYRKPYILVYGNALDDQKALLLRNYCRKRGFELVGAASGWKYADRVINGLDPFQWADLFRRAEAVVTATLHGLLYSIKYQKPFLMVTLPAALDKSRTVIEKTETNCRVVSPSEPFTASHISLLDASGGPLPHPDQAWIDDSRRFLSKALSLQIS